MTIFEEMGGTYVRLEDYLIPDLKLLKKKTRLSAHGGGVTGAICKSIKA